MGPTAAGKTDTAVELVKRLPLEIISVDSAMVYRNMDIGTGKPCGQVLAEAPHRLIDIRDPAEVYSAAHFTRDALREMADVYAKGRIPLLVGGTGLYFRALRDGLGPLPSADQEVRGQLAAEAAVHGWPALHARLAAVDRNAAARIHPHDPQRIQRALEVYMITGRTMTELLALGEGSALSHPVLGVVLEPADRVCLYDRIAKRFRDMLTRGLLDEVSALYARADLFASLPSMRAVGYRQVWDHLDGRVDYPTMVGRAIAATRQLAKRQLTWFRSERQAMRFNCQDRSVLERILKYLSMILPSPSRPAGGGGGPYPFTTPGPR